MSRVLTLPSHGLLLVATDLHGHLADFRAVADRFLTLAASSTSPQLVICGDLVHGPAISPAA
jgi:predicted phosphodiesterase